MSPLPYPAYFTSQISDLDSNIYFRVCFWGNSNYRPLQVQEEEGLIQARNTEPVTKEVSGRYVQKMLKILGKISGNPRMASRFLIWIARKWQCHSLRKGIKEEKEDLGEDARLRVEYAESETREE